MMIEPTDLLIEAIKQMPALGILALILWWILKPLSETSKGLADILQSQMKSQIAADRRNDETIKTMLQSYGVQTTALLKLADQMANAELRHEATNRRHIEALSLLKETMEAHNLEATQSTVQLGFIRADLNAFMELGSMPVRDLPERLTQIEDAIGALRSDVQHGNEKQDDALKRLDNIIQDVQALRRDLAALQKQTDEVKPAKPESDPEPPKSG